MKPNYKTLHKNFKFNGLSCSKDDLIGLAYDYIKEGEAYEQAIGSFLLDWLDENACVKVKTSGSTAEPKIIELKKSHMVNSALATAEYFALKPGDTALLCLSADYIAGKLMLVRAMISGLDLDWITPSSSPLEPISKHYDFCAMVPLQLENSLDKIDQIKTLIVGGAPISLALTKKMQNTQCRIFETYGMTETVTHIAVKKISPEQESFFKTLPNILITNDKRNCLIIDAPNIADTTVITNDVVDLISETEFKWLGRYDNIINSGGIKLFPERIEAKLEPILSNRFFVAGLPDEKLGQKLVLILEGEPEVEPLRQKIAALASLEKFEVPKTIQILPKFLETANGKIRRKEILKSLDP
jgi:O-succinylbenzoic acid--CoA ligase